ncbi:GDSL esterase/lipase At2g27360-like, partial [Dendrobium catenatum]|uniref:GDSL esterase/lipase At2g27360-like n=1 Tax=Dendrobium catenatum TaxID=906689 RepID=UPI0009F4A457
PEPELLLSVLLWVRRSKGGRSPFRFFCFANPKRGRPPVSLPLSRGCCSRALEKTDASLLRHLWVGQGRLPAPVSPSSRPSLVTETSSPILLPAESKDTFSRSLFVVGEIGGNDYNHGFLQSWSVEEAKSLVPHVINTISTAINDLIDMGAKTLLVPGNFPVGCIAAFLTYYENSKVEDYNTSTGCINWLNEFSEYHNNILKLELNRLRYIHPHTTIIYADYFNAVMNIVSPANSTRLERVPLVACCGSGGGRYNYGKNTSCGSENSTVCDDPSTYLSWDGMHFTEATYKSIAKGILEGPFADPSINKACSSSNIGYVVKELAINVSKAD